MPDAFGISSSIGTETVLAHITDSTPGAQSNGSAVAGDVLAHGSEAGSNMGATGAFRRPRVSRRERIPRTQRSEC